MRNLVETAKEILSEAVVDTTKPKTEKEKKLAAMGHPKDKITHKDVLIGRGVLTKEQKQNHMNDMDNEMDDEMEDDMMKNEKKKGIKEASYSAKAARAGKDIGKPGKMFSKIAKSAGEKYGSEERGEKVAGAVLKRLRANEEIEQKDYGFYVQSYLQEEGLESLSQIDNTELHVAMDIIEMAYQQQVESFDQLDEVSVATMIRAKAAAKKKAAKAEEEGDEAEVMKRSSQAAKFDTAAKKKFAQNK